MNWNEEDKKLIEKLKFWKAEPFVSLHQACMLAVGMDPYEHHDFLDHKDLRAPASYKKLYEMLDSLIHDEYYFTVNKLEEYNYGDVPESELYQEQFIFWPENVIFDNQGLAGVRQTTIKAWLENVGIDCPYYQSLDSSEDINTSSSMLPFAHSTRLLSIMREVINEFYGKSFDKHDRDTYTKQDYIVEWLRTNHSLSQRQAEAIDIITRPEIGKKPQGKK